MKTALLLTAAVACVHADPVKEAFEQFKSNYGVSFKTHEEELRRFGIFSRNMDRAAELTGKSKGNAEFGVTKFAHLTPDEFKQRLGYKPSPQRLANKEKNLKTNYPKDLKEGSIDWRTLGGTSPVKDQQQCGSCWAFSATEAIESGYWKQTGNMKILSPQQTVSCDTVDWGCQGGDPIQAYEYAQKAGGVESNSEYPYTSGWGDNGECKSDESKFQVKVDSYQEISSSPETESSMYKQIQDSPMSICVDAESWQMYMGGVVDSSTCGTQLDHCVHLVAYKENEYWVVKNSWNTNWGEEGYIRVKAGENACGIAEEATIVVAEDESSSLKALPPHAAEIVEGVADGFGLHMEEKCVAEAKTLVVETKKAVELMTHRNAADMAEAFKVIAAALKNDAAPAAKACDATKDELMALVGALTQFDTPESFVYHAGKDLLLNGVDIFKNINAAVADWKAKNYRGYGYNIGATLNLILIGTEKKGEGKEMYV